MRKSVVLFPMDIKYATLSLTPCTSRNCRFSAPGITPAFHVFPPSVVTTNVPPVPPTQTTLESTGLTEIKSWVVPLVCGVSVGAFELGRAKATAEKAIKKITRKRLCIEDPRDLNLCRAGQYRSGQKGCQSGPWDSGALSS